MIPGTQKEAFFFPILSGCLTKMPFLGAAFYWGMEVSSLPALPGLERM